MQPIQIFDIRLGNFVLPDKRYHDLVGLLQESSKGLRFHVVPHDFYSELLLLLERVDFARAPCSVLPKRILSLVTKSEEDISFLLMQGRFIVKLCLSQLQAQCHLKSS